MPDVREGPQAAPGDVLPRTLSVTVPVYNERAVGYARRQRGEDRKYAWTDPLSALRSLLRYRWQRL